MIRTTIRLWLTPRHTATLDRFASRHLTDTSGLWHFIIRAFALAARITAAVSRR